MSSVKALKPKVNETGLRPLGHAVLLEIIQSEIKSDKIIIPETVKERSMMIEQTGIVLAVGPEAWRGEIEPRAKVGDKVMVSRWAGHNIPSPANGRLYRMVNAEDVFAAVEE